MLELRQFKCVNCRGKDPVKHEVHIWYERVDSENPKSVCRTCRRKIDAVPRGEEVGVHICNFSCTCGHEFVVQCEMRDTAPCYECGAPKVVPHSFQPLRKINRKTDRTHNCSKCNGGPNCPNMCPNICLQLQAMKLCSDGESEQSSDRDSEDSESD